jgi:hypothetical protein
MELETKKLHASAVAIHYQVAKSPRGTAQF